MDNRKPETGAFYHRDRSWHPPALTPGYKTTIAPLTALCAVIAE